jgi:serine/threonine protein kinase
VDKIAQYDILGELGRGGMGVVLDAVDPRLDRHVAIKVIEIPHDPNMSQQTKDELIERFKREAKASAKLNHPNIVSIFDFGEHEGRYYMVMEFLQGRDLAQLLKIHSPLSVPVAVKAMIQTCEALDFAHYQGIIHRDIKPANIIILDNGTTKLTDFGIARLESTQSDLTKAGSILGSLLYISPEQLMNPKDVDKRADIYSLGVTAYEILTGQLPYNGSNIGEIVMKIMQSEPPRPSELNPQIPPELDGIIFKAMAKTVDMRYDTAKDFASDLSAVLQKLTGNTGFESATTHMPNVDMSQSNRGIEHVVKHDDNAATQYGSNTEAASSPTLSTGTLNMGMSGTPTPRSKEITLVEGIDDPTSFSAVLRILRGWKVENLSTNTMLEAIYKYEGKSQGLIINNSVILLIYKGLIVGAMVNKPELTGPAAYQHMASWQKFEMTQCMPLEKEEPWLVLMAIMVGANTLLEHNPMCSRGDVNKAIELQKSKRFSGMLRIIEKRTLKWLGLLDGQQIFSINMPYPSGNYDGEYFDLSIYAPRFNLIGPSLRKLLVEAQLQIVSKSINRPVLAHYAGSKEKQLTSEMMEEALRNTDTTTILPKDATFEIGNRAIKYSEILKETNHFKVMDWLLYEYMYGLSRSTAFNNLKRRFVWAWQFKSIKFQQPVKMGSFSATFDILAYNNQDQLTALFRFENEITEESLSNMVEDVRRIKTERAQDDIQAAMLVSYKEISDNLVAKFNQLTGKPGLFGLGESERGFVKMGWNKGFFLFMARFNENGGVDLIAPSLPVDA